MEEVLGNSMEGEQLYWNLKIKHLNDYSKKNTEYQGITEIVLDKANL